MYVKKKKKKIEGGEGGTTTTPIKKGKEREKREIYLIWE